MGDEARQGLQGGAQRIRLSRAARRASSSSCWACSSDMRSYMTFWVCRTERREREGETR